MPEKKANKSSVPSAVQQTINYLTGAIMRREYTPGSKIPTENDLADLVGVSRNTVREAVKILVFMGVLEIRRPELSHACHEYLMRMAELVGYTGIRRTKIRMQIQELIQELRR